MPRIPCNIGEFSQRMSNKYPKSIFTYLDQKSAPRIVFGMDDLEKKPGDIIIKLLADVPKWKKLGNVEFAVERGHTFNRLDPSDDKKLACFLTLKNPCDEASVDRAVENGFVWDESYLH